MTDYEDFSSLYDDVREIPNACERCGNAIHPSSDLCEECKQTYFIDYVKEIGKWAIVIDDQIVDEFETEDDALEELATIQRRAYK